LAPEALSQRHSKTLNKGLLGIFAIKEMQADYTEMVLIHYHFKHRA
jgi:hypothetical protein